MDCQDRESEDWCRFTFGPNWDRVSDWHKENAVDGMGAMAMYGADLEEFDDADGDGLPDHPDWDRDFEGNGNLCDYDLL